MPHPLPQAQGPYLVTFAAAARQSFEVLPAPQRGTIERKLKGVAESVGLRAWVGPQEAVETFRFAAGGYVVAYSLDPERRALVVEQVAASRRTHRR